MAYDDMIANTGFNVFTYIWTVGGMITIYGSAYDDIPFYLNYVTYED